MLEYLVCSSSERLKQKIRSRILAKEVNSHKDLKRLSISFVTFWIKRSIKYDL